MQLTPISSGLRLSCLVDVVVSIIYLILVASGNLFVICSADLEWKLIYVGSAEDETYDQLLESVLVGPVNVGNYRFVLQVLSPGFPMVHYRTNALSASLNLCYIL